MSFSKDEDGVLDALRAQYSVLTDDLEAARNRVLQIEWKRDNLGDAISALERMASPAQERKSVPGTGRARADTLAELKATMGGTKASFSGSDHPGSAFRGGDQPKLRTHSGEHFVSDRLAIELTPNSNSESIHPALAPYVGGTGQRLRSTTMVADLLASTDETVTRDELKTLFFTRYPRAELEKFWDKPDNAFGNALLRAVEERLVHKGKRNGTTEIFMSHAAYEKAMGLASRPPDFDAGGSDAPS